MSCHENRQQSTLACGCKRTANRWFDTNSADAQRDISRFPQRAKWCSERLARLEVPGAGVYANVAGQGDRRQCAFPDDDRMHELDGDMLGVAGLGALAHNEQGRAGGEAFSHASAAFRDGRRVDREELHRRGNAPRKVFLHD